ncbi:hypothetical protein LCI18_013873 [Fusarium solani-melongenae]|uniref:Uncharacterized protein n=1 Tax=Fusarium solani subsp. cucurbitae TaxID=2747967 RepID=A0ACD3ZNN8_FUSSC|nr:hypothetical protein LCI18_013873 [Fusarium solani-melongenae]
MTTWAHPSPQLTKLDAFRRHVNLKYDLALTDYEQLHKWSVDKAELFYREIWDFCGVVYSAPPSRVVSDGSSMWPRPEWYPGARLNFTENVLAVGLATHPDKIAVSACREAGTQWKHLTWKQLEREVARYASALKIAHVKAMDRVAAIMTNSLEAVLILLACASIGAIFSSTSPEMGANGIIERYLQSQPKVLFLESRVLYGDKWRELSQKLATVVKKLKDQVTGLQQVVVSGPTWEDDTVISLSKFLDVRVEPLQFLQVPFDHPVYILYSSHKMDMALAMDLGIDSIYYQYTSTGWMMWNMLVGALSVGCKIILYDGSPLHPRPSYQLRFLEEQGVTHWGTSPKFLATLMRDLGGPLPSLAALQTVLISGSALSKELCDWFYTVFPKEVGLHNGSGGTDMLGGTAALGMKVEIWDENGNNIDGSGQKGELVITKPFPSMPVTFWGEGGDEKYRNAYFDTFPGVWCHGDFVSRDIKTKGYLVHGRSDGVLNPGGVRFGTAEIYDVVSKFTEVDDSIAVGQRRPQDQEEQVLLFVKTRNGATLDEALESKIRDAIKTLLSPRHVPAHILHVKGIPYTMSGKKVEKAVKSVVTGERVRNAGAISNAECLKEYEKYASLPATTWVAKL